VQANLHQFLALALELDAGRYPSLPGFLDELRQLERAGAQEAPDEGAPGDAGTDDAIRILSIHGAKGLEAPVVALMDCAAESKNEHYGVLIDWPAGQTQPQHFSLHLPATRRGVAQQHWLDAEAVLEHNEDWNLLYVALTRARQWLLVSATEARKKNNQGRNWVPILQQAQSLSTAHTTAAAHTPDAAAPAPRWTTDFHPPALHIGTRKVQLDTPQMRLGSAWHFLLEQRQLQPDSAHHPRQIALQFALSTEQAELALTAAQRVSRTAALARFFDPHQHQTAANEMEIITTQGELQRIDRWVEFADECWVLDYKWQVTPAEQAAYAAQVHTYAEAMRPHAGTRPIRCGLITQQAELIEIPSL